MALDRSPELFSPQMNSTSLFLWLQLVTSGVGPVLIPRGIIWIKLTKVYKEMIHTKQEGQDGPGLLTWIFEITIAYFFFWGIETKFIILLSNFQKVTCKVHFEIWPSVSKGRIFKNSSFLYKSKYPPSTRAMFLDGSKFTNKFSKGSPKEHFGIFFFKSDQGFQRKRIFKNFIMSV